MPETPAQCRVSAVRGYNNFLHAMMLRAGAACGVALGLLLLLFARNASHRAPTPPPYVSSPPVPPPPPEIRLPDYRLKWLGTAPRAVSVAGDWNSWQIETAVAMARDDTGSFAADIYLPTSCPRINLVMRGVCCYRYKFYVDAGQRRRWLHDPRQPMDKDPDGRVNNFMCKYANGHDGAPVRSNAGKGSKDQLGSREEAAEREVVRDQRRRARREADEQMMKGIGGGGGDNAAEAADDGDVLTAVGARAVAAEAAKARASANQASASAAAAASLVQKYAGGPPSDTPNAIAAAPPPPAAQDVCLVLPATYFNGTTLSTTTTRGLGACCEICRRRRGCAAYNWRPEPLARNCVLFGSAYGVPRGTALCSAGIVRVPLDGGALLTLRLDVAESEAGAVPAGSADGSARRAKRKGANARARMKRRLLRGRKME